MIVSWKWLQDYVPLNMSPDALAHRLAMSGFNHERTETVGEDLAIDLEITSNRPDCLGHLGIGREIGVLWDVPFRVPALELDATGPDITTLCQVRVESPEMCPRYVARVIRNVKVGPSPEWLVQRLATVGLGSVNNVVDVTNYVLMECGQPLHAFDLGRIPGGALVVRAARKGESIVAIDHRKYDVDPGTCVIADQRRPVALAGVMGGAETEVSAQTHDILIEAADFDPLTVRGAARRVGLHSPSSYRFERGVDPDGIDWASRRCCQLILQVAGGELAAGSVDVVSGQSSKRLPIVLRLAQLPRVLGISIPPDVVQRILTALGNQLIHADEDEIEVVPPSWRRDLTREIDLIEEVVRVHGYDQVPEDAQVAMIASHRDEWDRLNGRVRDGLTAMGFDEALTVSVVSQDWSDAFSPWTPHEPLRCNTPLLRGADYLRRSLIPSLLGARQVNQALSNPHIQLFEIARIYLPGSDAGALPDERRMLGLTADGDFFHVKGVLETLADSLDRGEEWQVGVAVQSPLLDAVRSCELIWRGERCGVLGEVSAAGKKQFGLRGDVSVAEIQLDVFLKAAGEIPQYESAILFPAVVQDLNLIADESVRWGDLVGTVRHAGGNCLRDIHFRETYRDPAKDGAGKKRLIFSFTLQSSERTLTRQEADTIRDRIVTDCQRAHGTHLLSSG